MHEENFVPFELATCLLKINDFTDFSDLHTAQKMQTYLPSKNNHVNPINHSY